MLITLLKDAYNSSDNQGNYYKFASPNRNALGIQGDFILTGDSLNSIQISRDGGYNYEPMVCNVPYSGSFLLKTTLEGLKGYQIDGNYEVSGSYSDFPVVFNGSVNPADLILDNKELNSTFEDSKVFVTPQLLNQNYIFNRTFYGCYQLETLDMSNLNEDSLRQSKFNNFCPVTTTVLFNDYVDKELVQYILSQRHK